MERVQTASSRREQDVPVAAALTIVIPSFNERDNVPELLRRLDRVLVGVAWEAVIVDDDSPDKTWEVVRDLARRDPGCAASGASAGVASPAPASRVFSPPPPQSWR